MSGTVVQIASKSGVLWVTTFTASRYPQGLEECVSEAQGRMGASERSGGWSIRVSWQADARHDVVRGWCERNLEDLPPDLVTRRANLKESYLALVGAPE